MREMLPYGLGVDAVTRAWYYRPTLIRGAEHMQTRHRHSLEVKQVRTAYYISNIAVWLHCEECDNWFSRITLNDLDQLNEKRGLTTADWKQVRRIIRAIHLTIKTMQD